MAEFFLPCENSNLGYTNIRDLESAAEYKKYVELLWSKYKTYADPHFREDAKLHFQERFWEMYLGNTFLDNNFELKSENQKGPEFYINIEGHKCWVEAIAPGPGIGLDAVPEMQTGQPIAQSVPNDEIILRLRHAIFEKHKKYLISRQDGIIESDAFYVLAINSKKIRPIVLDSTLPLIVKATYPFGNLVVVFDKSFNTLVDTHYEHRGNIKKKNGSNVSTDIFLTSDYEGISAVLSSDVDAANKPNTFGSDFRLVHNKMAANPLPLGTFKFGIEYWIENGQLNSHNWG